MGIFSIFKKAMGGGKQSGARNSAIESTKDALVVNVVCDRCGENVRVRLRKTSEIQRDYEGNADYAFFVNKTIVGNGCFNRMDMRLEFDERYQLLRHKISGGHLRSDEDGAGSAK